MPIYAYRCSNCGHAQDVLQKMSDAVLTVCPACGQPTYVKQVTAAGFQLKGSGWYVTDFRDGKSAKPKEAGGADAAKSGDAAGESKAGATDGAGEVGKQEGSRDGKGGDSGEGKGGDGKSGDAKPAKDSAPAATAAPASSPAPAPAPAAPAAPGKTSG